jgi:hypothetical protein
MMPGEVWWIGDPIAWDWTQDVYTAVSSLQ